RWLLISRERGVPAEEGGGYRWSVDHLFLDQDAVPTIVEVKRSSDTRIRREVVGQMLDYAANAVVYWPVETIRAEFEANHEDPQQIIAEFLSGTETDEEEFWQKVKTNLQAGKVRLVFVADKIPQELRRVVEFLNQQMDPAEVLAVEIKQYVGGTLRTLVPRVIGQTVEAQQKKSSTTRGGRQWDEASFFEELKAQAPAAVEPARAIYEWAINRTSRIKWGKGRQYGSFYPTLEHQGAEVTPISLQTYGSSSVWFGELKNQPPFTDEHKRLELLRRLNDISGVTVPRSAIEKYPSIPLTTLNNEDSHTQFLGVLDWIVQEIRAIT
ncbi:MAG: hypothetical protein M3Q29_00895, partial [Chloroflexota bacterium]|nr:hypothetical protein [Chloroflexota bacterium]